MTPSRKKVIVRLLAGDTVPGYLPSSAFVRNTDQRRTLELLDLDGRSLQLPLVEIKSVCFVREFNRDEAENPERLSRRAFLARPRREGLWLRLTFTTGDLIEGLAPQDVSLLDALLEDAGLFLTPPDERANTHRIFVPRTAIATLEFLAVINAPPRRKPTRTTRESVQPLLFTP